MRKEDVIGRWYDIEHGMQKTYFKPTEIHTYSVVDVVGTIIEHNDELMTFGTAHFSFKLADFNSTFIEDNVVNSKVVYEFFDKNIKKFSQTF